MTNRVMVDQATIAVLRSTEEITEGDLVIFRLNGFYISYQDEEGNFFAKSVWGEWVNLTEKGLVEKFAYSDGTIY